MSSQNPGAQAIEMLHTLYFFPVTHHCFVPLLSASWWGDMFCHQDRRVDPCCSA